MAAAGTPGAVVAMPAHRPVFARAPTRTIILHIADMIDCTVPFVVQGVHLHWLRIALFLVTVQAYVEILIGNNSVRSGYGRCDSVKSETNLAEQYLTSVAMQVNVAQLFAAKFTKEVCVAIRIERMVHWIFPCIRVLRY